MRNISVEVAGKLKDYYVDADIKGANNIEDPYKYFNYSYVNAKNEQYLSLFAGKDRLSKDICVKLSASEKLSNYEGEDVFDSTIDLRRKLSNACLDSLANLYRELFAKVSFGIVDTIMEHNIDPCLIPNYERVAEVIKDDKNWDVNIFTGHEYLIPFSERQKARFTTGMKLGAFVKNLMSIVHKFKKEFDLQESEVQKKKEEEVKELLEKLNIELSRLKQAQTLKGKLYLSCDPMDILSASDTNCKWSSCFSTGNGYGDQGCNAVNPLGVLNSDSVFIAYLNVNDSVYDFEGIEIPDKTLRAWVEIQEGYVKIAKTYPFDSMLFKKEVAKFIKELMPQYEILEEWESNKIRFRNVYSDPAKLAMKSSSFDKDLRVNDPVFNSSTYHELDDVSDALDDFVTCAGCGDMISESDAVWDEETEEWYCQSCYEELCAQREREEEERRRQDEEGDDYLFCC